MLIDKLSVTRIRNAIRNSLNADLEKDGRLLDIRGFGSLHLRLNDTTNAKRLQHILPHIAITSPRARTMAPSAQKQTPYDRRKGESVNIHALRDGNNLLMTSVIGTH